MWVFGGNVPTCLQRGHGLSIPWPSRGYIPWTSKVADPTQPWSFSLPDADFSGATVTMTNDANQALTVSNVGQLPNGYGDNTLSWKLSSSAAEWSRAPADTKFGVQLTNVKVAYQAKTFQYTVTFFVP
ncbi:hypothetical protein LP420_40060 [Massilia sp. B-10]|nr:hypothetical protein LP420_40060 [Massilia sp. B-10]